MLTEDIKPAWGNWLNVIRRLQEVGCKQNGLAIAKITVILNDSGEPVFWLNPEVRLIEPKKHMGEEEIKLLFRIYGRSIVELIGET